MLFLLQPPGGSQDQRIAAPPAQALGRGGGLPPRSPVEEGVQAKGTVSAAEVTTDCLRRAQPHNNAQE